MKLINKILIVSIIAVQSIFSIIGVCAVYDEIIAYKTDSNILIDNVHIGYDKPIVTINDSIYVPLRETFEQLGFDVEWKESGTYIYTKDLYQEINMRGYIYHFIYEQLPINKTQILENGLLEDKIFGVKIISKFENAQDVAEHISAILDETDKYVAFKNTNDRYFNLYSAEDIWIINWQTKVPDILECEDYYIVDKDNGYVKHYTTWGLLNYFSNYAWQIKSIS